ncbi:Protein of unknown function DUF1350 [Trichormus variabilis ATCC 29413]|uniref:DUF1350 domain-containing protein n=2 Tax=Anabaena variabilis TaxID=264691 RepID=Q3M6Q7_TRIV2|nr:MULTISPECIES: DUF1350 family protein [Nostocaceae]ABA23329.1 Protein of unknown function DUF1350 [Trichormus variabilis ATCC 29413]MBC1214328.1 DUF1350 family protein [Trichormus variabilis ARAD]MBC1258427.1 DUF1350 family protein [Trichormus variabilis V5]MBC1269405.1 DUF1350 family protein [Trichormus variabilis FSR]MBC1302903.1 DUF1350 family protein [Trichormus variabilis N2B]
MDWKEIRGNWVLVPRNPVGIIHFLGGAFVATAPHLTYRWLLEQLGNKGYVVIATPFVNTLDHIAIANSVLLNFERTIERLHDSGALRKLYLPTYGIGHSMGCKLHLLIGSLFPVERAGNILISFNNYAAKDAIPLVEQFNTTLAIEFTPSPLETNKLVQESYNIRRNLLIKFNNDNLDQSAALTKILQVRFPEMVTAQTLPGTHTTPLGQDVKWQTGSSFTPFDALGQWFKQEVYRDLNQLNRAILLWLNPLSPP